MDGPSQKLESTIEMMDCPLCNKTKIPVMYTPGYSSWKRSSISAKSTRTKYYHSPKYTPQSKCPACSGSQMDIKAAFERGHSKQVTHEDRIARLKAMGFSCRIESEVKN